MSEHVAEPEPTADERAEAAFTTQILVDPGDRTVRLVFADWLEERGRRVEALYMRQVRTSKFRRLVAKYGGWAMTPEFTRPAPPLTQDLPEYASLLDDPVFQENGPPCPRHRTTRERYDPTRYTSGPPPAPSPRLVYWREKIRRGWLVPKWMRGAEYFGATEYFGVYVWEYINVIVPVLRYYDTIRIEE